MSKQIITSKQYTIDIRDGVKALVVAILTPVILLVQQSIMANDLVFNWRTLAMAALSGGVGYLVKNFFTSSEVKMKVSSEVAETIEKQTTNT